jgi:hypothetical protein
VHFQAFLSIANKHGLTGSIREPTFPFLPVTLMDSAKTLAEGLFAEGVHRAEGLY